MSAPIKVLIMVLLWAAYTISFEWLAPKEDPAATASDATAEPVNRYPVAFRWDRDTAFIGDGFDKFKNDILKDLGEDNFLEITGLYHEDEVNPDSTGEQYASMGFARGERLKALFDGSIPADRIRVFAKVISEKKDVRTNYFKGGEFKWAAAEEKVAETVEEMDDRILIRFPFGKVVEEYDPAVEAYLKKLAERIKETGETVTLTGHADNVGTNETNFKYGSDRAEKIKSNLVKLGVDPSQIETSSKGETQPRASNETEEGRYENRRVEVRLIKNENSTQN